MKTTSLELSQRLKVLGVPQVSYFTWVLRGGEWVLWDETMRSDYETGIEKEFVCSYLSDELGEWLKSYVDYKAHTWEVSHNGRQYVCGNIILDEDGVMSLRQNFFADTPAEATGLMLEYLIINGYIKVEELK